MTTTALSPLQTQRHGLSVAVMGDGPNAPVYAVGGHDGWSYINTVERFYFNTNIYRSFKISDYCNVNTFFYFIGGIQCRGLGLT